MGDPSASRPAELPDRPGLRRHAPLIFGGSALLLAIALGVLIVLRQNSGAIGIDEEWAEEMVEHRMPFGIWLGDVFNVLGGTIVGALVIPLGIIVVLLALRRPWAALYFAVASASSALVVQLLKNVFGRARPTDMLITSDFGSFPSGHVANAATVAFALAVIFPFVWVWIAGSAWVILMALSRTYLGAHWLTDTIGGALVGLGVAIIIWTLFAVRLDQERSRRRGVETPDDDGRRVPTL